MIYEEFVTLPKFWQNKVELYAGQPGSWNHELSKQFFVIFENFAYCSKFLFK